MNLESIKKILLENMNQYKPIPFWSWNAELCPKELCRQIEWMKENEIGGFFMHARGGLKTEYLSEEWMNCIKICSEYAQNLGMQAWVYDENGWPSGFAGGKLLEEEKNRDKYILYNVGNFDSKATVSYVIDDDVLQRAYSGDNRREFLNLYIHTSVSNADILNPRVVDKFINLTHERYKKYMGNEFSEKICGFFTDEPQYQRNHTPYTDAVSDYFKEKYDIDIFDELGLLFLEKKGYRKFRYKYWSALQELMLHSFSKKIYDWCIENSVSFTGHYLDETSLAGQLMCCGGIMPFYEYMTVPGIDWLGRETDNELPARQLASVAAQTGKKQTLSESFGCCGWQVTPKDLKRIADFQFLNGVNLLCHHLVPYAEYGQRKRDYPAHYSPVNPWVNYEFASFNQYFARLGKLLSESKEKINVALLHPIRSAYFDYKREEENNGFGVKALDTHLGNDARLLSSSGVCYHFLDEVLLKKHGSVKDSKICCGECEYEYLVLPHILTMDNLTEKLLREFAQSGGKVLILGDKPKYLEGEHYDYNYLNSNCTLEEIIASQPFKIKNVDNSLYYTYREIGEKTYLMIQNISQNKSVSQSFDFLEKAHSFRKLNLFTLEESSIPLNVILEPGESILVFPDDAECEQKKDLTEYVFNLNNAKVDFKDNILTVDTVRYSINGIDYSKKYSCAGLFQKLLDERYEGKIYLKYEFEIRKLPSKIVLKAEALKALSLLLNGREFEFTGHSAKERHLLVADISDLVNLGINEFTIMLNWHQSEDVYFALYGENVTESLKNCIVYDTELEAIYLAGDFGVYSDEAYSEGKNGYVYGREFYIDRKPERVSEPVTEGLPFFAGKLDITQKIMLDTADVSLRMDGTWLAAYITINGKYAGGLVYERNLDISEFAVEGENTLQISFIISNRNMLGPHHCYGHENDTYIFPWHFELTGSWRDGISNVYDERYSFLQLGV